MSADRLAKRPIVGDTEFGLTEKDATFARLDARKIVRRSIKVSNRAQRTHDLFEDSPDEALLNVMAEVHHRITSLEEQDFDSDQILRVIITNQPNLNDYRLLLRKSVWGQKLIGTLDNESYKKSEAGELWDDFVAARIGRALTGRVEKCGRYDGRNSYNIRTKEDIIRLDPESNAHTNDGPEFSVRGNKINPTSEFGWDSDQRFNISLQNVTEIKIRENEEKIEVIKEMTPNIMRLVYRREPVGSTHQIEIKLGDIRF